MLNFMRKQAKSWIMKIILFLIIIVFIGYFGSRQGDREAQAVAKVENKFITHAEYMQKYQDIYKAYRKYLGNNFSEELMKKLNLKQQTLDFLIRQAVITNRAADLGLTVTEEEVREAIYAYPSFQRNGVFDPQIYEEQLRENELTPEEFERNQRDVLNTAKVEALIRGGAQVSDRELFDLYSLEYGKINVRFVKVSPKAFIGQIKPANADLEKFLKDNGAAFRVPEKIQARYLYFSADHFAGAVRVTDDDIKEQYSFRKAALDKAGEKSLTPDLKEKIAVELKAAKAMELAAQEVKKARDAVYQYDNMEGYAQKNNLQIHQTDFFAAENPPAELAKIKDIRQQLANLKKGDLSPILSTPEGHYLLQVTSVKSSYIPPLSEVREAVAKQYTDREAVNRAENEAKSILEAVKKGTPLETAAKAKGQTVAETGLFLPDANIPKIGASKELAAALYEISAKKPCPDSVFYIDGEYVVVKFEERAAVDAKEFETKKQEFKNSYLRLKESGLFHAWVAEQIETLKKQGKLKYYKQVSEL